jgi:hypothetical protein
MDDIIMDGATAGPDLIDHRLAFAIVEVSNNHLRTLTR